MTASLDGRIAIVTGGGRGIGAATVEALAAEGASVAVFDLDEGTAAAVAGRVRAGGAECRSYGVDVTDRARVDAACGAVSRDLGDIDILVNNAGIGTVGTVETMPVEDWTRVIDVNLTGPFHCIQAVIPAMKARGGAIVNVASIAGKRVSYHGGANYTAAKSGLLGLTRHAAFDLARYGIRVNAVCPGPVLTPMAMDVTSEAERAVTAGLVPMGRWIMPKDVARLIVFLAGPESAMCTGASFDIDGGMLLSHGLPAAGRASRRTTAAAV